MSRFYVAQYVSGTDPADLPGGATVFYPAGAELSGSWSSIDLRPPGQDAGFALLRSDVALPASQRRLLLTDDPDDTSQTIASRISSKFGFNIDPESSFRRLVFALLARYGDDANPSRWNDLRPTHGGMYEVWLGELMRAVPVVAGGAVVSDDFNRADSTNLGANWVEQGGDVEIFSNQLRVVAGASSSAVHTTRYEVDLATADHFAQIVAVASPSTTDRFGPRVRNSPSDRTSYVFWARNTASTAYRLEKTNSTGAETVITSVTAAAGMGLPSTLRAEISGSSLTGYDDGVSVITVTDTSITGNRRTGIYLLNNLANGQPVADNFSAGDLSSAVARSFGANVGTDASTVGERCFGIAQ